MKAGTTCLVSVVVVLSAVLDWQDARARGDDMGTNFFLKASKSVPRIGRRSMEDFMKASKSVPRIGRRRDMTSDELTNLQYPSQAVKRYYSEKDIGESGEAAWGAVDPGLKDFSSMMQGDEPYRGVDYPGAYWQQMKRYMELEEPRQQALV